MANLNINLLPENLSGGSKTVKLKKTLNQFLFISLGVFVAGSLVAAIVLFVFSLQLQKLEDEKTQAETNVKNLQDTEQKLFFIQDRLTKVKTVQTSDTLGKDMEAFNIVLNTIPPGAILREAEVNNVSISTVIETSNPSEVTSFLSQIVTKDFKRINLQEFNFNPGAGYSLTMIYYPN